MFLYHNGIRIQSAYHFFNPMTTLVETMQIITNYHKTLLQRITNNPITSISITIVTTVIIDSRHRQDSPHRRSVLFRRWTSRPTHLDLSLLQRLLQYPARQRWQYDLLTPICWILLSHSVSCLVAAACRLPTDF